MNCGDRFFIPSSKKHGQNLRLSVTAANTVCETESISLSEGQIRLSQKPFCTVQLSAFHTSIGGVGNQGPLVSLAGLILWFPDGHFRAFPE